MAKLKSERHHWWPECVSEFWKDRTGCVTRLTPDGETRAAPPKNWGVIQNGHMIKLADDPAAICPWDESYESQFQIADENFTRIILWLQEIFSEDYRNVTSIGRRFVPHDVDDEIFTQLIECMISLAVRSPKTRSHAVAAAERFRGVIPERQRNGLIGMNIRNFHRDVVRNIDGRGKVAILISPEDEFIFGDGFYHTLNHPPTPPHAPCIVVPITPNITAVYARPMSYMVEPRFCTMLVNSEEVRSLNDAVQIYSANMVFYRDQKPSIQDAFRSACHQIYASNDNPVDYLIHNIPGMPDIDRQLERWLESMSRDR